MKETSTDLHLQVALFTQETQRLEKAYQQLQKQFEYLRATLDTSRQTLEQIITHMSDGLMFITQEGIITLYNPAVAKITDISEKKVRDTSFWNHFSDSVFGFSLKDALKERSTPSRLFLSLSNGRQIEVAPSLIPKKGLLLLLNDRTILSQLESSVQQNDRLKELGEIAATLAHEIRNPLGGIEGFASLLKKELTNSSQQRMIAAILEGSHTINMLVTHVLEYTRPLTLHFVSTQLAPFIYQTAQIAKAIGYPCKVVIEKPHTLSIDPKRIQLILLNLIQNAYEAYSMYVEIVLTKKGNIEVRDKGEGIAPERLKKIFIPFFTTKTSGIGSGTGLGLSEAYKVMRAHGGHIHVDSKVGEGTCIILTGF